MSARDKIQRIKDRLCWSPGDKVTPEQLGDLANAMDANFDALLDDLDPLPEPDKFDLEPSDFGDIEEDGGDDGAIGGGDDGDDGEDGQDGGPGGGPGGCIVPARTPTGITGMRNDGADIQPGTGVAILTSVHTKAAVDEKEAFDDAVEATNGVDAGEPKGPFDDALVWDEVAGAVDALFNAQKPTMEDPEEFNKDTVVVAYNISSQEVEAEKNILLGTDEEGRYWVLVESCDEDEDES